MTIFIILLNCICWFIIVSAQSSSSWRVSRASPASEVIKLYKSPNFQGESTQLQVPYGKHCVNLQQSWNNVAISVDLSETACLILFVDNGCNGRGVRLEKFSFGTMNLDEVKLKNEVSSLKLC